MLKDDLAETSNIYFERAKEKITFLNPELDLRPMDMFKIVHDGQVVDVLSVCHPSSPVMDLQP